MLNGVDISKWQGEDFDVSNEDFVIVKATEGRTYTDPYFHHNIKKALNANKLIGAYHYARPENNTPQEEAKNFVDEVKDYIGKCLLALDWEGTSLEYPVNWALDWLKEVERLTGVKPLIYCSQSVIRLLKIIADNGNGIWCAKWSTENKPNVEPFSVLAIWQYTSRPHDKDIFYGDVDAWMKYAKPIEVAEVEKECTFCRELEQWLNEHGYVKK